MVRIPLPQLANTIAVLTHQGFEIKIHEVEILFRVSQILCPFVPQRRAQTLGYRTALFLPICQLLFWRKSVFQFTPVWPLIFFFGDEFAFGTCTSLFLSPIHSSHAGVRKYGQLHHQAHCIALKLLSLQWHVLCLRENSLTLIHDFVENFSPDHNSMCRCACVFWTRPVLFCVLRLICSALPNSSVDITGILHFLEIIRILSFIQLFAYFCPTKLNLSSLLSCCQV